MAVEDQKQSSMAQDKPEFGEVFNGQKNHAD